MDIIINSSKKKPYTLHRYHGHDVRFWFVAPHKPHNLNIGDKVYFAIDNFVVYYHFFQGFAQEPRCELTGRILPGLNYILTVPRVDIEPIPIDSFYGFKYKEN